MEQLRIMQLHHRQSPGLVRHIMIEKNPTIENTILQLPVKVSYQLIFFQIILTQRTEVRYTQTKTVTVSVYILLSITSFEKQLMYMRHYKLCASS